MGEHLLEDYKERDVIPRKRGALKCAEFSFLIITFGQNANRKYRSRQKKMRRGHQSELAKCIGLITHSFIHSFINQQIYFNDNSTFDSYTIINYAISL